MADDGKLKIGTEVDDKGFKTGVAKMKKGFSEVGDSANENTKTASSGLAKLKDKFSELGASAVKFVKEASGGVGGLKGAFKVATAAAGKMVKVTLSGLSKMTPAFKAVGNAAVGFTKMAAKGFVAMSTAAVGAVTAMGKIGIEYSSQMENYTTNFKVMLGSEEAAVKKVDELKKMAAKTPFGMEDLAKGTQTLLAFNVASDKSTGVLKQLGDISLGNSQKLETLTRAYGKMNAAQKVSMEDINMMIDSGFNPLLIVSEKTGESMTDLYKRVSDGGVAFEEIQEAINIATSEGGQFFNGMEEASHTITGLMSTLKDNAQALLGEVFEPISNTIRDDLLPGAIDAIDVLTTAFREDGVEGLIAAATDMIAGLLTTFTEKLPEVINMGMNIVMSLFAGINENLPTITSAAVSSFYTFVNGFLAMLPELIHMAVTFVKTIADDISANPDKVINAAGEIFFDFVNGIIELLPSLITLAIKLITSLGKYLWENKGKIWESAKGIGKAILDGIWGGIEAGWSWLTGKVSEVAHSLLDGAKSALGIHSPSKEFAKIGEFSAEGMGIGFEKKNPMGKIQKILKRGLQDMNATLNPIFSQKGMSSRNEYYNQQSNVNIYGDVTDPDVVARKIRLERRYGLAGAKA